MKFTIAILLALSALLAGCGSVVIRHVPMDSAPTMRFSQPAIMPPPPTYLQRGLGCRIVDSSYRSNSRHSTDVRIEVERCRWTRGNDKCESHARYTTILAANRLPTSLPEVQMDKVTECSWSNGKGRCQQRVEESARLIPRVDQGGRLHYEKVQRYRPNEDVRCRGR